MNSNLAVGRAEISSCENPYESPSCYEPLGSIVSEIFSQLERVDPTLVRAGVSAISRIPCGEEESAVWLALVMYASRAALAAAWRDRSFDALLLDSDVRGGSNERVLAVRRLLDQHGDILQRIQTYDNIMNCASFGVAAGTLVTTLLSWSQIIRPAGAEQVPLGTDMLAYELSGWCAWMIGLGGLGAGLWGAIYTWSQADNAESVARKAVAYVRDIA